MLELPEVVESTLGACQMIGRIANYTPEHFVAAGPAFVEAGAVPAIVALLLCPERSGLIRRRKGEKVPPKQLPDGRPVKALAALLKGAPGAAEAAFAAGALPKLVALWGLGLKYGRADSQGRIQVNEFAMQCFNALSVRFGAEVAAVKAAAGIADPPPPMPLPAPAASGDAPTAAAAASEAGDDAEAMECQ